MQIWNMKYCIVFSEANISSDSQGISCILWKNKCLLAWSAFVLIPSHINPIHPFSSDWSCQPQYHFPLCSVRHQHSIYHKLPSDDVSRLVPSYVTAASTVPCAVTLATPAVLTACCLFSHQQPSDVTNYFTCAISWLRTKRTPHAGLIYCKLRASLYCWLQHAVDIFEGTNSTWCWSSSLKKDLGSNFGRVTILQPCTSSRSNKTTRPYMW